MRSRVTGTGGVLAGMLVPAGQVLAAGQAMAAPTSTTAAGQAARHGPNPAFIAVAVVFGLLILLLQRRNLRRFERTFNPEAQRPDEDEPPG